MSSSAPNLWKSSSPPTDEGAPPQTYGGRAHSPNVKAMNGDIETVHPLQEFGHRQGRALFSTWENELGFARKCFQNLNRFRLMADIVGATSAGISSGIRPPNPCASSLGLLCRTQQCTRSMLTSLGGQSGPTAELNNNRSRCGLRGPTAGLFDALRHCSRGVTAVTLSASTSGNNLLCRDLRR